MPRHAEHMQKRMERRDSHPSSAPEEVDGEEPARAAEAQPLPYADAMTKHLVHGVDLIDGIDHRKIIPSKVLAETKQSKARIWFGNLGNIADNALKLKALEKRHEELQRWNIETAKMTGKESQQWMEKEAAWKRTHDTLTEKDARWQAQSEKWYKDEQQWRDIDGKWRECCGLFIQRIMHGSLNERQLHEYEHLVRDFNLQERMGGGITIPDRAHMMMPPPPPPPHHVQPMMAMPQQASPHGPPLTDYEKIQMAHEYMRGGFDKLPPHAWNLAWVNAMRQGQNHQPPPPGPQMMGMMLGV